MKIIGVTHWPVYLAAFLEELGKQIAAEGNKQVRVGVEASAESLHLRPFWSSV